MITNEKETLGIKWTFSPTFIHIQYILYSTMENIVGVMDMDGFRIQKRFFCKELGLLKVGDDTASSFFFNIGVRWSDLDEKDTRCCKYLIRKSRNFRWEYLVAQRLTLWWHWKSWSLIFTKAYKGMESRRWHIREESLSAYHHCAKVEVEAFGHWLTNQVHWWISYRFSRPHS